MRRIDRRDLAAALAAALPGFVLLRQAFTGYVGLAWLAFCVWQWRSLRGRPEVRHLLGSSLARGLALSFVLTAALVVIHHSEWGALHNPSRFVLVLPMALVVAVLRPSCRAYFATAALAGLIAGAVALWQVVITQAVGPENAQLGFTNRNKFGYVAASLVLLCIAATRLPRAQRPALAWLAAGVGGAAVALVLANTRGAWLACLLPLWIWIGFSRAIPARRGVLAVLGTAALATGLATFPGSPVRERIEQGVEQFEAYQPGVVVRDESVAERLEMWRASLAMAAAHPWIGVGPGRFNAALNEMIDQGRASAAVRTQGHPHNEYLSAAATGGLIGVVALLAALFGPLAHFVRAAREAGPERSIAGSCALAGALVAAATAIFCITDPFFYIHFSTLYYALSMALLAGFVEAARRAEIPA